MNKARTPWIDIFKALGIILIVIGHTLRFGVIRDIVYSFHVPAFFFIFGVTAKEKKISKKLIWNDFKRLMIPYYIFGVASIVIYATLGG